MINYYITRISEMAELELYGKRFLGTYAAKDLYTGSPFHHTLQLRVGYARKYSIWRVH